MVPSGWVGGVAMAPSEAACGVRIRTRYLISRCPGLLLASHKEGLSVHVFRVIRIYRGLFVLIGTRQILESVLVSEWIGLALGGGQMEFGLDDTQEALRDLAAGLLAKEASLERLEAHERDGAPYDQRLWQALREAGLTAICAPEHAGGAGLGPVEMAVVLREAGQRAVPGPLAATLVSTLAASLYGAPEHQQRLTGAA